VNDSKNNNKQDMRDYYIFGEKVEFQYGKIRFLKYKEYIQNMTLLSLLGQNVLHLYYQYSEEFKKKDELTEENLKGLEELKNMSLLEIVRNNSLFLTIYLTLFDMLIEVDETNIDEYNELYFDAFNNHPIYDEKGNIINEDVDIPTHKDLVIARLLSNEDEFMQVRKIMMDMNVVVEDIVSENPEIQAALDRSKQFQQATNKSNTTFVDMITSIVVNSTHSFEQVGNMNVYQVYSIYYRIAAKFNYETSVLFATVAPDVKVEDWSKHINLFESNDTSIKKSEFDKQAKGLFG
jgi:hypothetical protein